jgi:hypothetical protein
MKHNSIDPSYIINDAKTRVSKTSEDALQIEKLGNSDVDSSITSLLKMVDETSEVLFGHGLNSKLQKQFFEFMFDDVVIALGKMDPIQGSGNREINDVGRNQDNPNKNRLSSGKSGGGEITCPKCGHQFDP